jgi:hypothetical protein
MKKHFYSHLIDFEPIVIKLTELEFNDEEQAHLLEIAQDSIHHEILDVILSELSEDDKKYFLHLVLDDDHEEIWVHLNARVENIEVKIKEAAQKLQEELHRDIQELKEENDL